MPFSRLRNVIATQASTVLPAAPPAESSLRLNGAEPRPSRTIADDWEEVAESMSVHSVSSGFDDDTATLAEYDAVSLDQDDQGRGRRISFSGSDFTSDAAVGAPHADLPPDYELIAPSTEGYAASVPRSENNLQQNDTRASEFGSLRFVSDASKSKQVRPVSSQETLAEPSHVVPRSTSPGITARNVFASGAPGYKYQQFSDPPTDMANSPKGEGQASASGDSEALGTSRDNPTTLYKTLEAVTKLLEKTAAKVAKCKPDDDRCEPLSKLEDAVLALNDQCGELEPILRAYSKHWAAHGSGMAAGEVPIDARLFHWMSSLQTQVMEVQGNIKFLDIQKMRRFHPKSTPYATEVHAKCYTEVFNASHTTMATLLPAIKSDFNLFNTRLMQFPVLQPRHGASSSTRRQPPNPAVARMRFQLYGLKDQIHAHYQLVKGLQSCYPPARMGDMTQALQLLATLSAAATTILTNNGSEWIQSDLDARESDGPKVLPYADFVSLDADVLHDVAGHLKQMHHDLGLASVPPEEICFSSKPLQNHQLHMLTNEGSMKKLIAILEFTKSILMPSASP
ncbi:hypothetical protein HJFPF1_00240 [Paramyrothecium foliicola]|nr:hypothetical protein HJFPF1_00240 [Paramyrothecium foliicola]